MSLELPSYEAFQEFSKNERSEIGQCDRTSIKSSSVFLRRERYGLFLKHLGHDQKIGIY